MFIQEENLHYNNISNSVTRRISFKPTLISNLLINKELRLTKDVFHPNHRQYLLVIGNYPNSFNYIID